MPVPRFRLGESVTPAERAFYEEYGFIIYESFLDDAEVNHIKADVNSYQRRLRAGEVPGDHVGRGRPVNRNTGGEVRERHRLHYLTRYSPSVAELARSDRMSAILRGIGGPSHWLLENTMNGVIWQLKSGVNGSGYRKIRWHQDFPVGHTLSPAFTAGVYLDDSTRLNGCLAVVPCSHRFPVGLVPPEPFFVEVRAGDLVCHHERIFHGSEGMPRPTDRRATVYLYCCAGKPPAPGIPFDQPADPRRSIFEDANQEAK